MNQALSTSSGAKRLSRVRSPKARTVALVRRVGLGGAIGLVAGLLCLLAITFAWLGERRETMVNGTVLANVAATLKRFEQRAFNLDAIRKGHAEVPRLFAVSLPPDVADMADSKVRKSLFIRLVLPLVLQANAEIRGVRSRLLDLRRSVEGGRPASAADRAWLDDIAARYGADPFDFPALLARVDTVPVSLVLAQAIEESGWGTSRFAVDGNALFGQRAGRAKAPGMRPRDIEPGTKIKVRVYPDLLSSVRSYIHNLNTHHGYEKFRSLRASARERAATPNGHALAEGLMRYSERGPDYVAGIRRHIRRYRLEAFDSVKLEHAGG